MTLHFTLILHIVAIANYIYIYIDSKMPSDSTPDSPSISMLCMLIVLHTITHDHSCTVKLHLPDYKLLAMPL